MKLMKKVRQHIQALQVGASDIREFQDANIKVLEIDIPGFMTIYGIPANPDTARGYTGDVFLDEFAQHADDGEVWSAILPTITRDNGELDMASTPRGRKNVFAKMKKNKFFAHQTVDIYESIRDGNPADAELLRGLCDDEEMWQQEYLCLFIDGASVFIKMEEIDGCVDRSINNIIDPQSLPSDKPLFMGVDVGRRHDSTVIYILSKRDEILRTEGYLKLEQTSFDEQEEMIGLYLRMNNMVHAYIDESGIGIQLAENMVEQWGDHKVTPFNFSSKSKSRIGYGAKRAVNGGRLLLPDDPELIDHFHSVEKTITDHGNMTLRSPKNDDGHGDIFWGGALAVAASHSDDCGQVAMISTKG